MGIDRSLRILITTIILTALPAVIWAQAQSGIAGVARDTTGAVLPGVTVEAASPALIEKVRTVVTDERGQYKIVDLRPGTYAVTFTLAGFHTVRREGVQLTSGFTASINADMSVGTLEETVLVSSQSPVVDVQNARQQRVITVEVVDTLPSGRNWQAMAAIIPGMQVGAGTGGSNQDVGGLKGEGNVLAIHGGHATGESRQRTDGMLGSNGGTIDRNPYRVNTGMVQEINYELGVNTAENDSGGVITNIITKEGGNRFSGSVFGTFANEDFQSDNLSAKVRERGLTTVNSLRQLWDLNPGFGGPIKRDKMWFYGSFRYWGSNVQFAGLYHAKDPQSIIYQPDLSRPAINDTWTTSYDVRLTWQVTPRNKLSSYWGEQPRRSLAAGGGTTSVTIARTPEGLAYQDIPMDYTRKLVWTSPVTNRILLLAGFSFDRTWYKPSPSPGVTENLIAITDVGRGLGWGAAASYSVQNWPPKYLKGSVSYVTGSHAFKVGYEWHHSRDTNSSRTQNDVTYTFLNDRPTTITMFTSPTTTDTVRDNMGIFAQDQWTVARLTVNAGVRWDYYANRFPAKQLPPVRFVGARDFPEVTMPRWMDVNPRLAVSYDLFGTGKTAVKSSISGYRVHNALPINPDPLSTSVNNANRSWNDANGDFVPQCDLVNLDANGECGPISNRNFGRTVIATVYDPELAEGYGKSLHSWETTATIQHEVLPEVSAGFGYFRRTYDNFTITDNLAVSSADYDSFCVTAPADARLPGGGGHRICGLYDLKPSKFGQFSGLVTFADQYGERREVYDGIDAIINARLPKGAFVQGGVNFGRTKTDNCLVVDSPQALLNCEVTSPFFQPAISVAGMYPLVWDLQLSGTYQHKPGPEITASYTARNAEIVSSLGRNLSSGINGTATVPLITPGTLYEDALNQFDFRITRIFRIDQTRIRASFDLYNAFNSSAVLGGITAYGANWLRPTSILDGRLLRISAQLDF